MTPKFNIGQQIVTNSGSLCVITGGYKRDGKWFYRVEAGVKQTESTFSPSSDVQESSIDYVLSGTNWVHAQ